MKVTITLKDPDGVYDSISQAAHDSVLGIEGLTDDERDSLSENRRITITQKCGDWIQHGEYVSITIDTDAGTATVNHA